jgi:hypothetical protein
LILKRNLGQNKPDGKLAEFDCTLKYKVGKTNVVADTLVFILVVQCLPLVQVESDIFQQIRAEIENVITMLMETIIA